MTLRFPPLKAALVTVLLLSGCAGQLVEESHFSRGHLSWESTLPAADRVLLWLDYAVEGPRCIYESDDDWEPWYEIQGRVSVSIEQDLLYKGDLWIRSSGAPLDDGSADIRLQTSSTCGWGWGREEGLVRVMAIDGTCAGERISVSASIPTTTADGTLERLSLQLRVR